MRSLFFKIFMWFWFTVIVVGIAIAVSVWYSSQMVEARNTEMISAIFRTEARNLSATIAEGKPVDRFISRLEQKYPVRAYFLRGNDLAMFDAGKLPPQIQKMAVFAIREDGLHVAGPFASQRITGPGGELYALVIATSASASVTKSELLILVVPVITLVAGGVFCFLIARHVTAPLMKLSAASEGIAGGRLDTRAGTDLQKRHDEIGGLGRAFDRMADRIEALVKEQQELLANISHELRSPLARMNVALELLQREGAVNDSGNVKRIALEAQRLDQLIGQLLLLSRLDSKLVARDRSPVDLTNLAHEVAGDANFEARATSRCVEADVHDRCVVDGDEELIRSALENVIRNAVRFTPEGARVEVSLRSEPSEDPPRAVLRVRDHGPGVPESMLPEIFQPFTRASANGRDSNGAGLGLAIAQRAVAVHGGTIHAVNMVDGGLMVEIRLPMKRSVST